jgi:hypothetical protein
MDRHVAALLAMTKGSADDGERRYCRMPNAECRTERGGQPQAAAIQRKLTVRRTALRLSVRFAVRGAREACGGGPDAR